MQYPYAVILKTSLQESCLSLKGCRLSQTWSVFSNVKENANVTKNREKISELGLKRFLPLIAPQDGLQVQSGYDLVKLFQHFHLPW